MSTQILEAGVDLDFDTGFLDFYSLLALIQMGGRVGRNQGNKQVIKTFYFSTNIGTTREILTNYRLENLQNKYPQSWEDNLSRIIYERENKLLKLEREFFDSWEGTLEEETLLKKAQEIYKELPALPKSILPKTLKPRQAFIGLNHASWSTLSNIYGENELKEIIILPTNLDPEEIIEKNKNDTKYGITIEQNYCIRGPQEYLELIKKEGYKQSPLFLNDTEIWIKE
jgi:CRISPR/Cas system-associated endonuclease/helicase Cas3